MTPQRFQQRFIALARPLRSLALTLLGCEADAEDAVQEVFLKLWQQADKLESMQNAEGYFTIAVRNECIRRLRRKAAEPPVCSFELTRPANPHSTHNPPDDAPLNLADSLADADTLPDAEEHARQHDEATDRRLALLHALPEQTQLILRLRHAEMLDYEAIAALTGICETNLRAIVSRARRKLAQQFSLSNSH